MNDQLKEIMDNMYDARVPEVWEKLSWQSSTLGFWFTELLERDGQFKRWCFSGRPKAVFSTLIGPEDHSVATPAVLCHKEPAQGFGT